MAVAVTGVTGAHRYAQGTRGVTTMSPPWALSIIPGAEAQRYTRRIPGTSTMSTPWALSVALAGVEAQLNARWTSGTTRSISRAPSIVPGVEAQRRTQVTP